MTGHAQVTLTLAAFMTVTMGTSSCRSTEDKRAAAAHGAALVVFSATFAPTLMHAGSDAFAVRLLAVPVAVLLEQMTAFWMVNVSYFTTVTHSAASFGCNVSYGRFAVLVLLDLSFKALARMVPGMLRSVTYRFALGLLSVMLKNTRTTVSFASKMPL